MTDEAVFKELYRDHVRMVYNLCLNCLRNAQDAEEVTQDVFVKVHRRLDGFRGDSRTGTWIYRIAINCCTDHRRTASRKKRARSLLKVFSDMGTVQVKGSPFDHPGVQLEHREATERIFKRIDALPENQRNVLLLKAMDGLSQVEIAEIVGVSTKAVESLLSRARRTLEKDLGHNEGNAH